MTDQEYRETHTRRSVYCETTWHEAYLSTEFGLNFAMRITGLTEAQLEAKFGRNSKGKRKGLIKGMITWQKVLIGGWHKAGFGEGNGYVVAPGQILKVELRDDWNPNNKPLVFEGWELKH